MYVCMRRPNIYLLEFPQEFLNMMMGSGPMLPEWGFEHLENRLQVIVGIHQYSRGEHVLNIGDVAFELRKVIVCFIDKVLPAALLSLVCDKTFFKTVS